jgi:nucleotide-binding universal stress UspA family protein
MKTPVNAREGTEHILIPIDGTLSPLHALRDAEGIAQTLSATLLISCAVAPPTWPQHLGPGALLPSEYQHTLASEERAAHDYLEELAIPLRQKGLPVDTQVERGDLVTHILETVERTHPILVILPVPDRMAPTIEGEPLAPLDDYASQVVAQCNVPVLVVPSPEQCAVIDSPAAT